ncbi:MAG: ABC transporter transmembrane domain-containing protein, partial [Pseudomonadota bacterium]
MKENENLSTTNEFQRLLGRTRYTFYAVFLFAFATNLLMLITPFYALQVLGRVIPTGSFQTLFVISFIVGIIYFIYSLITLARSYTLIKLAHWLDNMVGYVLFKHAIVVSSSKPNMRANNLMNDFKRFKSALTGVVTVIFDMPFACMYLFALYVINFKIFVWTLFAGLVIISLSVLNASITTSLLNEQSKLKMKADYSNMKALQNAKLVHAMGIISNVCDEWKEHHLGALGAQMSASYRNTFIMQLTALLRNWFQMGITILGAYSVIMSGATDMTVGMMIVCSILFGKFLGPFSQMLNTYKTATMAYFSYLTLDNFFSQYNEMQKVVKIPNTADLTGRLVVENVSFAVDQQKTLLSMFGPKIGPRYLLRDLNFTLEPGEFVGVIGEIGSGKSLAALIACGAIKPTTGRVTMDGIDVSKCDREQLGMHMGIAFQ